LILRGATLADLPDPDTDEGKSVYSSIKCPVLILTIKGDDAHPVSTAYMLTRMLPQSTLHVAEKNKKAHNQWPSIIADFISKL